LPHRHPVGEPLGASPRQQAGGFGPAAAGLIAQLPELSIVHSQELCTALAREGIGMRIVAGSEIERMPALVLSVNA
jgi:hypothetical protein